ncbi:MAG: PAS domain S-box protein, partial [Actinomycetota bacterium]|nr:PAS domain S-box protein [Actinomycetota bacterium]
MSVEDLEENFDPGELGRLWEGMESGQHVTLDGMHRRKDGSTFPVEIRIGLFQTGASRLVLGAARDVTERKSAEEGLRRSERNLATAQRIASIGSWEFDPINDEERWSDETYRILGLAPRSFVPSVERFLASVHPEDKRSFEEYALDLSGRSATEGLEHRIVRPDGQVRVVCNRREVERDATGRPIRAAGTVQDVTEQREAEQRLREAERKYRTLIEQLPAVTYIQDAATNDLSYASPQLEAVLGYGPEEYLANPALFAETIHPDDREWVLAEDARTDRTGEPYSVECRRITGDGRVVWVHDEARLVRDAQGGPLFWQGFLTDITECKRSEAALKQSEELYRAVVEQAAEGIYLVDPDTKLILESNPAFCRLLGRTGEELSGMTLYDVVAHDTGSVDLNIRRILEEGRHFIGGRQYRHKDGSLVDVDVNVSAISFGGREAMCIVAHDITERKRAERALRESEEMFRAVFENAATGVALTDRDGRFVRVNAALATFLAYGAEEVRGKTFAEVTHPDDVEPNLGSLRRLLDGEVERYRLEKRYVRKDGAFVWGHVTVSGIRDADGEIRYVLGLVEDITERKRAQEEIRQLNEDLERRVAERTSELEATITDLERAQSALRREEARTRAIVETAPDAIVTITGDGLVRSFNPGAERMFGYSAAEILGRPLTTLMPGCFRTTHEGGPARHLATGESTLIGRGPVELAGLRKGGSEFPLELTLGELREEGELLFTGIVRDMTERKEAEEKVRTAEERYRTLVERMPAVTYIQEIGSPDSAMYMSPQIEALTGYTPEACQDPDFRWRLVHPADRERLRQSGEEQTGEPGEVFAHEYRVVHRDGRTVWVRNESVLIEDEATGSRYWHGFMVDITERKQAEAGLRAYAEK